MLAEDSTGKLRIAQLGGDQGRYFTKLPRGVVTILTPDETTASLAAHFAAVK